jgi:hypothetical protein
MRVRYTKLSGRTGPGTNKLDKGRSLLELANTNGDPLRALGIILEEIMEVNSFGLPTPGLTLSVRKDLNLDPSATQDEDLRKTLSGLASIVDGIGGLRTHKGSAHGQGRRVYRLKSRHARLVVHAASTLAIFIIESWNEKKLRGASHQA